MKKDSPDDRLSAALAELPTAVASPGFTRRVLRDLQSGPPRSRARRWQIAAGAVAAATLLVVAGLQLRSEPASEATALEARARSLRTESERLRQELEQLRLLAEETAPVLYLGETESFDLVLDLRPYVEARVPQRGRYAPARLPERTP